MEMHFHLTSSVAAFVAAGIVVGPLALYEWARRSLSRVVASWTVLPRRMLSIVPIARDKVVEWMAGDSTQRKLVERALEESEDRYRQLADSLPLAIYEADLTGRLMFGNRSGVDMFGYSWEEFERGLNIFALIVPEDRERATRTMAGILAGEPSQLREYTALKKDGSTFPVMISATAVLRDGLPTGIKGFVLDISVRKRAEEAMRVSEERYRTLAEAAQDLIFITDLDGKLQYVNGYTARYSGCEPEALIGSPLSDLLPWDTHERQTEQIRNVAESGRATYFEHRTPLGGHDVWLYTCLAPLRDDHGRATSVLGVSRDTTELAQMREELRALSLVDDLTGLQNRRGFLALAEQQLKIAHRNRARVAILLADFDGLKEVNDGYGHNEGDRALKAIARILKGVCRDSDVVARLGGDEFAVLAVDTEAPNADTLVHRILRATDEENASASRPYQLSLSIGVVHDQIDSLDSIQRLLAESDRLMYQDKRKRHIDNDARRSSVPDPSHQVSGDLNKMRRMGKDGQDRTN